MQTKTQQNYGTQWVCVINVNGTPFTSPTGTYTTAQTLASQAVQYLERGVEDVKVVNLLQPAIAL